MARNNSCKVFRLIHRHSCCFLFLVLSLFIVGLWITYPSKNHVEVKVQGLSERHDLAAADQRERIMRTESPGQPGRPGLMFGEGGAAAGAALGADFDDGEPLGIGLGMVRPLEVESRKNDEPRLQNPINHLHESIDNPQDIERPAARIQGMEDDNQLLPIKPIEDHYEPFHLPQDPGVNQQVRPVEGIQFQGLQDDNQPIQIPNDDQQGPIVNQQDIVRPVEGIQFQWLQDDNQPIQIPNDDQQEPIVNQQGIDDRVEIDEGHADNFMVDNKAPNEGSPQYQADWPSLNSRPVPRWYHNDKFGIFIHWGVFSVPSFSSEWFWVNWLAPGPSYWKRKANKRIQAFMAKNYKPNVSYVDFAPQFTAQYFNASQWAEILASSGARYVVLTSKHHEGYTLWPSNYASRWNAMDVGPRRDLLGELTNAVRGETTMRMGFYYSLYEWFHPLYLQDRQNGYKTQEYVEKIMMPELKELVNMYQPDVVWGDGEWEAPSSYWKSPEFLAWLYNESPVKDYVVTNDRWGSDARCKYGSFLTCDDRFDPGAVLPHKWENCSTIDKRSWGFVRNARLDTYLTIEEIIKILTTTVSYNGNLLLNIGPTHDGLIDPIFELRLRQIGSWLKVNGESIYGTSPWRVPIDKTNPNVRYTMKEDIEGGAVIYAIFLQWPADNLLILSAPHPTDHTSVHMLGHADSVTWGRRGVGQANEGIVVLLPRLSPAKLPCKWAWVVKLYYVT